MNEVEDERLCSNEKKKKRPRAMMENTEKGEEREGIAPEQTLCTPLPSPRKCRKAYTHAQGEFIASYFSRHISTRQFPTTAECREFLELYPQGRTPKGIHDKCRNLAGR